MKLGIDFGTCFSLPAVLYLGQSQFLLPPGKYGIPSVFYYDEWEDILIGEQAERAGQGTDAVNLKREIKLALASSFTAGGRTFTGRQIAAYILADVAAQARKQAADRLIPDAVEGAVISVPASFTQAEKQILLEAAQTPVKDGGPGLKVLGMIKEPVAAALSYFRTAPADHSRILVYDLGGGTFDAAIVEADSSVREKYIVTDSATLRVGGKDWDARISEYLADQLEKISGTVIRANPGHMEKVLREAVAVKHGFSESFAGKTRDRVRARIEVNGRSHTIPMTSALFDELTMELFSRTVQLTKELLARNPGTPVKEIICVGGSTNMPQVRNGLAREFPDMNIRFFEPEKAVAAGAAIYAEYCDEKDHFLSEIAAWSYGTDCFKDFEKDPLHKVVVNLIRRGDRLPVTRTDRFITTREGQRHMYFDIFESENNADEYDFTARVRPVLEAVLELPPGLPKKTACTLHMTLTTDNLLTIEATYGKDHAVSASLKLAG